MQTERNSSGGLTGGKHWSTLALAACGVSVLILGCVEHQVWTPYAQHPAPTRALDGQEVPLVSLPASAVQLTVQLTRPGGKTDEHRFAPSGDFVRSPDEVYEPHSFSYKISARHGDRLHRWEFAAPEMQTTLAADVARRSGLATAPAGPATLVETLPVYGQVKLNANRLGRAVPRFAGLVREARKSLGDSVAAGEVVAVLETNQTLALIEVRAPLAGVIIEREVHAGQTVAEGATLYIIADLSEVWVDLHIPKRDQSRVKVGQPVTLHADDGGPATAGTISWLSPFADAAAQTREQRRP